MKIIHVTPQYFGDGSLVGGGERYVDNLVRSIAVASAALGQENQQSVVAYGEQAGSFERDGYRIDVIRSVNPNRHPMAACGPEVWGLLGEADLVHVHQSTTYFGAYHSIAARSLGKKLILTDHGGGDNSLMLDFRGVQLADGMLCQSEFAAGLMAPFFNGPRAVVIGPIDTDIYKPPAQDSIRSRDVLCVGRLLPHKGLDRIVRALPEGLRLVLVGRAYDPAYHSLLLELGAGKDVKIVTDANDAVLLNYLKTSGLMVHGSVYLDCYGNKHKKPELMGIAPLEGMACGLPMLVSNVASLPELANDDSFFGTFESVHDLRSALTKFRDHRWPSASIHARAHRWVRDRYGMEPAGRGVLSLYHRVMYGG